MKSEFFTGSLDAVVHWLNIKTSQEIDGHFFYGHDVKVLPQGILAQAIFLTPDEQKSGEFSIPLGEEESDED